MRNSLHVSEPGRRAQKRLCFSRPVTYATKGDVPVSVVAKSLLANERLVQESVGLLAALVPGLQVTSVKMKVSELSNRSPLKEVFALGLFLAYQEELEREVPALIQALTGTTVPEDAVTLVTVLVLMTAAYVVDGAVERLMPGKSSKALKAEYENKREIVARLLQITPEQVEAAVSSRYSQGREKSVFQRAVDFFLPAKIDGEVAIESDDPAVRIGEDAVAEVPDAIDYAQIGDTHSYTLEAATIEIHRADRDENKHGWRGVIRDVTPRKVRIELNADLRPDDLYGKTVVTGDVTVVEELQPEGGYAVKAYHLVRVISST